MSATANKRPVHFALFSSTLLPVIAGVGGVALWQANFSTPLHDDKGMLMAPMIGVTDTCIFQADPNPSNASPSLDQQCNSSEGSAAALIESTLEELQPSQRSTRYQLGYTLPVPLLQLFKQKENEWTLDDARIQRLSRTIRDNPRPLILYLFSTHFSSHSPLEGVLASNPKNLATAQDGPISTDSYYGSPIYNWNFASTDTEITHKRAQAINGMLDSICRLPSKDIKKIKGITILGELHHLFPNFESGMGFTPPYKITDYSQESIKDFQSHLKSQFKNISHLNQVLQSNYTSFTEITPPSKNIRTDQLSKYTEHIDSYAHGFIPISGWTFIPKTITKGSSFVHIYLDGKFLTKTPINKDRQDVLSANPNFGYTSTGWRFDMDFRNTPHGIHRIDLFIEKSPGKLMLLGTRNVSIMSPKQNTPKPFPQGELPHYSSIDPNIQSYIDTPQEKESFYFNPLVIFWHQFREKQITRYIQYFDKIIAESCLEKTPRYTHQIIPFTNPSWDFTKFAVEDSLRPSSNLRLGVSLYGDATHSAFSKWYRPALYPQGYGITEFHPLKPLKTHELDKIFTTHEKQGAKFLSFFLEPSWEGHRVPRVRNIFSFAPDNEHHGSSTLYISTKENMTKD